MSTSTQQPDSAWEKDQTEAFIEPMPSRTDKPLIVMHHRDTKFTKEFVAALKAKGIRTNGVARASPQATRNDRRR